jgi:hypothetical protein
VKDGVYGDPDDHQMFSEICLYIVSVCVNSMTCSLIDFIALK